jgi:hypothetical protein
MLAEDPARDVRGAAGRERHDDLKRLGREGLAMAGPGGERK